MVHETHLYTLESAGKEYERLQKLGLTVAVRKVAYHMRDAEDNYIALYELALL